MDTYRSQLVNIDLGNLLIEDPTPLELHKVHGDDIENHIRSAAQEALQLLINKLAELPKEYQDEHVVVKLPEGTSRIPREKRAPSGKDMTKWERYAKMKGITKRKKTRMVWDDPKQKWLPRWGKDRIMDDKKEWCLEVPQDADPFQDQFEKMREKKKERIAKNELQRLRNISRNMKGKVPPITAIPGTDSTKADFTRAFSLAQTSDASLGKFSKEARKPSVPKYGPTKSSKKKQKRNGNARRQTADQKGNSKAKVGRIGGSGGVQKLNVSTGGKGGNNPKKSSNKDAMRRPMKNKGSRTGKKRKG